MKLLQKTITLSLLTALTLSISACGGATPKIEPKYKADIPHGAITPDKVQTDLLGDLTFRDGMPSAQTVTKSYDFLDTARASETFLNTIPAVSMYAMRYIR